MPAAARIQIALPPHFDFATRITVEVGHLNYGNHLANDAVLRIVHEARLRFLSAHGCTETDAFGASLIMADAAVQYRAQAFHGDELLIQVALGEIGRAGFPLFAKLTREADQTEIARVQCGMAFYDYTSQRLARTPAAFREHFARPGAAP
ncbi:thioesterase family protein [Eikenella sp. S3360]|uniref:Thioesterase family protein n=1 Tax=Eikenella glucosivorans TaxID=2766967 RepID=A0ABS0NBE7_9NEIS|nr:thioesterase family protein [Eikenella glucosivorans]MBH5329613.1 thioesterase family protein [Eikenella glucosivorans]